MVARGVISFFFPETGSSRLVCLRSPAALRLGFSAAVSCARLIIRAVALGPQTATVDLMAALKRSHGRAFNFYTANHNQNIKRTAYGLRPNGGEARGAPNQRVGAFLCAPSNEPFDL